MTRSLLAAALSLAMLAACTPAPPPKPPATQGDGLHHLSEHFKDLRFAWTAEPGIDLVKGPMVAVRAYEEGSRLAGTTNKESDLYPGFARAVLPSAPPEASSPHERVGLWPIDDDPDPPAWLVQERTIRGGGVLHMNVLSLTPLNDGQWAAVYCTGDYSILYQQPNGKWSHTINPKHPALTDPARVPADAGWGGITRVVVQRSAETPAPTSAQNARDASPPQQGPLPAPEADVFGEWKVVGQISIGSLTGQVPNTWPDSSRDYKSDLWSDGSWGEEDWKRAHDECMQKAPDPRETRVKWMLGEHDGPYPYPEALPAPVPGWPAAREG
ncbi:MAG: hypothetical protein ACRC20_06345 [Segniliparus sp.]|uniref:hypothetical protein n=1 Tax=Segniliparus sp. TaxID=2804064 RepID=UPI003F2AB1BC